MTIIDYYSCFISHSSKDKTFAHKLYNRLTSVGIECWLDEVNIDDGEDFYEAIKIGVAQWDKVILCCSKSSLSEKWWVDYELNLLFDKERKLMLERGKKVLALIPINLDNFLFSPDYVSAKGDEIRSRNAPNFTGWENDNAIFDREIERVINALRTDGGKKPPPPKKL